MVIVHGLAAHENASLRIIIFVLEYSYSER